jgi:hypothetical protein
VFPDPDRVDELGQEVLVGQHEVVGDGLKVGRPALVLKENSVQS